MFKGAFPLGLVCESTCNVDCQAQSVSEGRLVRKGREE